MKNSASHKVEIYHHPNLLPATTNISLFIVFQIISICQTLTYIYVI